MQRTRNPPVSHAIWPTVTVLHIKDEFRNFIQATGERLNTANNMKGKQTAYVICFSECIYTITQTLTCNLTADKRSSAYTGSQINVRLLPPHKWHPYVCIKNLENVWTESYEIWYTLYAIDHYSNLILTSYTP
jgi:hypothetical protein